MGSFSKCKGNPMIKKLSIGLAAALLSSKLYAFIDLNNAIYFSASAGVLQGTFNTAYNDHTDVITQSIANSVLQNGYTAGAGIGYRRICHEQFLFGAELSGNIYSDHASFKSGAATSAFTDKMKIKNNVDLDLLSGILVISSLEAYLKIGLSYAQMTDQLTSPAGFIPSYYKYKSTSNAWGLAAGLGIRKLLTNHLSVFSEYNHHDYGKVVFSTFTNFTADYHHTAKVSDNTITVGASYNI